MSRFVFRALPVILALFSTAAFGQQPGQQKPPPPNPPAGIPQAVVPQVIPCPQLQIQGPTRPMRDGEPISFGANIGGGDPNVQPIYSWSISSGTIISGQGTRNIAVDSSGAGSDRQIVADLLVGGYSVECNSGSTYTVAIAAPAKKVDEFGDLSEKDEAGKLDSIVNYLAQAPDRVHLIGYAGRTSPRGYAVDVLRRMKTYLAKSPVVGDRITMIDGGFRETPSYEIWVVPIGAESPRATPTIDRKDIVFPKPTPTPKPTVKKP